MYHSQDEIEKALDADAAETAARQKRIGREGQPAVAITHIDLEVGDSAWGPDGEGREFHGPFRIIYRRYSDGMITTESIPLGRLRSNHWTPPALDVNRADGSVRHIRLDV